MKISKSRLRRIIREEVSFILEAKGFEVEPDNNTILGKIGKKIGIIPRSQEVSGELFRMSGVSDRGLENSTEDVRNFAKAIGYVAKLKGIETPVVTSGKRSAEKQAESMYNKFKKGEDLIKLYATDCAECQELAGGSQVAKSIVEKMINLFKQNDGYREAAKYLKGFYPQVISAHQTGESIDLRVTSGIEEVIKFLKSHADISIIDETSSKFPHWHVHVRSFPNNVAKSLISQWKAQLNPITHSMKKYMPDV